jgi:nicotinamidase-related amidase
VSPASSDSHDVPFVVIDMQRIFGEQHSPWFAPRFVEAATGVESLLGAFRDRVVFTRFLAPAVPQGAWIPYYEQWPFALDPANASLYDMMPEFEVASAVGMATGTAAASAAAAGNAAAAGAAGNAAAGGFTVDKTTFGKWGPELAEATRASGEMVLAGVSTDCCVLSTALAAVDEGVRVRVVSDACAGISDADHQRALDVMALYAPLIEITTVRQLIEERAAGSQ